MISVGGWSKDSLTKNAVPLLLALLDVVSCAQTRIAASRVLTAILAAGYAAPTRQRDAAIAATPIFPACGACALDKLISLAQDIDPRVRACVARLLSVIFSAAAAAFFAAQHHAAHGDGGSGSGLPAGSLDGGGAVDACCSKVGPPLLAALSLTSPRVVATRCAEELFELLSDEDGGVRAAATASAFDVVSASFEDSAADTFGARALLLTPLASLWLAQLPCELRLSLPGGVDVEAAWGGGNGGGGGPLGATAAWAKKGADLLETAVGAIVVSRAPRLMLSGVLCDFIGEGAVPQLGGGESSSSSGGALSAGTGASTAIQLSPSTISRTPFSTVESSGGRSPKGGVNGGRGRGSASVEAVGARLRADLSSPPALLQSLSIFLALSLVVHLSDAPLLFLRQDSDPPHSSLLSHFLLS